MLKQIKCFYESLEEQRLFKGANCVPYVFPSSRLNFHFYLQLFRVSCEKSMCCFAPIHFLLQVNDMLMHTQNILNTVMCVKCKRNLINIIINVFCKFYITDVICVVFCFLFYIVKQKLIVQYCARHFTKCETKTHLLSWYWQKHGEN